MAKRYLTQSRWSDQLCGETIDVGFTYTCMSAMTHLSSPVSST